MKKIISIAVLVVFFLQGVLPATFAQKALEGSPLLMSASVLGRYFQPPVLRAIKIDVEDPFTLEFVVDPGDSPASAADLKDETNRLVKYFLAGLTLPENDLWVNLSPYEKDRIIADEFGATQMGRDLLAQDYLLKQITASLMVPEGDVGKKFWNEIYRRVKTQYGDVDIPVNTLNKVWIVPDKAEISEELGVAYIGESHLKVLLESDYLALEKNGQHADTPEQKTAKDILREIILPVLEKEVNEGRNFALLRQVYHSLILSAWYKQKIKSGLLAAVYVDQKKVTGINNVDPNISKKIWSQYEELFRKGVYNSIKEELDPLSQEIIPRKYFMGGFGFDNINNVLVTSSGITTPRIVAGFVAGVQLLSALPLPAFAQNELGQGQGPHESIEKPDPRSAFEQQRKDYWLNFAHTDPDRIFSYAAQFMEEPFAMDILKQAVRSENVLYVQGGVFRDAYRYLEYEKGWEFFEWLAENYDRAGFLLVSANFTKIKSPERALEIIARFSSLELLNFMSNTESALRNEDVIRQMIDESSSQRLQLIKQISQLPLKWQERKMMVPFIPMMLNNEMTILQAQELVGDVDRYMKTLFLILKNPAYANDRKPVIFRLIESYFLSTYFHETIYPAKWEPAAIDAYLENFSAQDLYYSWVGLVPGELYNIVFAKLLKKLGTDSVNFYDVPESLFFRVNESMLNTTSVQKKDLMSVLSVDQKFSLVNELLARFERARANNNSSVELFKTVSDFLAQIKGEEFLPESRQAVEFNRLVAKHQALLNAFLLEIGKDPQAFLGEFKRVKDAGILADNPMVKVFSEINRFPLAAMLKPTDRTISTDKLRLDMVLLLDDLLKERLTLKDAAQIVLDRGRFLRQLNAIASKPGHLAETGINQRLGEIYMELIRNINNLHEAPNALRFKSVENFSAEYLYRVMVYGEDEIVYTTTFNGLFDRLMTAMDSKHENISPDELLDKVGDFKFRNFFRLAVTYGRQEEFLEKMSSQRRQDFLVRFIEGVFDKDNDASAEAAIAADVIDQLKDPQLLDALAKIIKVQYEKFGNDREKRIIYGLLAGLLKDKSISADKEWFVRMGEEYKLLISKELSSAQLFDANGENVQRYVFYDDSDAKASFAHFIGSYKNDRNWRTIAYDQYVEITSVSGQKVTILANKPRDIEKSNLAVDAALKTANKKPSVIAHRGHSYFFNGTIGYVTPDVAFVGVGACGGAKNVGQLLEKSPQAHIAATKGVGTMRINDPLFMLINNDIRTLGYVNWESVWTRAEKQAWSKTNEWGKYVGPHRNVMASFLKTYDTLMRASSSSAVNNLALNGGIDLNAVNAVLQVNANGETLKLSIDPALFQKYQAVPGFYPEIKFMRPVGNVVEYLTSAIVH